MSVDFSELTSAEQFIFKETTCHDRMVQLVEQMLELDRRQAAASASDREYELYGLTDDEIKIIEEPGV